MNKNKTNRIVRNIWVILFIITLFILLINGSDIFYYADTLCKIKYLYLLYLIIYFIITFQGYLSKKVTLLISILLFHSVLFGFFIVNPIVSNLTHTHGRDMIIYIAMIWLTYYFVWNENIFKLFIRLSYYDLSAVLIFAGLKHLSDFVNPVLFIHVFSSEHGYRSTFGFGHANFVGNMTVFALIYSIPILESLFYNYNKDSKSRRELLIVIVFDIIIGEMLFSTESRTSILAGIVFSLIYFGKYLKNIVWKNTYIIILIFSIIFMIGIILLISGVMGNIWANSNRTDNISSNMPYFKLYNPWTGMGYIPSYGFLTKAYGYETYAVDIYYLYIFFTTGYIGIGIITIYLVLTLLLITKNNNYRRNPFYFALFTSILITGLGQTNMIQYTLYPSMLNWIIIFLSITPSKDIFERRSGTIYERYY